jgi:UDP-N-acetylmuramoyl-tripeptide--D-alanyl-D-alanine ligase
MGMSGIGEISRMSRVAKPSIGVITNIGISHIEKLGSQSNILKAKLEITDGMGSGGRLVVNGDDKLLSGLKLPGREIFTYGIEHEDCGIFADNIVVSQNSTQFDIHYEGGRVSARLPVCGRHNVYNALAAFACGRLLGITPEEAVEGFENYAPPGLRQKIEDFQGITLIKDCYNASPDSMNSAFDVLKTINVRGRRIAVLADMLELGSSARQAHADVGRAAFKNGADMLLAYGSNARFYCEGFESAQKGSGLPCRHFSDKTELAGELAGIVKKGDAVLFKGSRGMMLEDVIDMACERWKS